MLPDGTGLRFRHNQNNGHEYTATVKDGYILDPNGEKRSPNGAAREVDKALRPKDWHDEWDGWGVWEWYTGEGWEPIHTLNE